MSAMDLQALDQATVDVAARLHAALLAYGAEGVRFATASRPTEV